MAASASIPLQQYLTTVYEPDVDYVDGVLEDRHVGEYGHNIVQRAILFWFYTRERAWRIRAIQEQRTRVASTKVRLPDISVFWRNIPVEQVFTRPQLIAVEVLSPEDRHSRVDEKIANYIAFGVQNIWVVDPLARAGWDCSSGDWSSRSRFAVATSPIYLDLPELFKQLDREREEDEEAEPGL